MRIQALFCDGLHIGDLAQTGDAVGVLFAQLLQQLIGSVTALIVALGFQCPDEILFFTGYILRMEGAVYGHRIQQDFFQKLQHRGKDSVAFQGEAVINKTAGQTGRLNVAGAAHQRAYGCTVQIVQLQGNCPHIRCGFTAPQQYCRQQRVQRCLFPTHRP